MIRQGPLSDRLRVALFPAEAGLQFATILAGPPEVRGAMRVAEKVITLVGTSSY